MILFSDLHLRPESAETCFAALDAVRAIARERGDRRVACLGDFFHIRYVVPVEMLNAVVDYFREWVAKDCVEIVMLPGNHDSVDVNGRNALEVLDMIDAPAGGAFGHVRVFTRPTLDGANLWLPYRLEHETLVAAVKQAGDKARYAFVHHGLQGAVMNNGIKAGAKDGLDPALFSHLAWAFFGHWHRHQVLGNCVYVGSPWQTKADEAGQTKGVVALDEDSGKWGFVPLNVGKKFWRPGFAEAPAAGDAAIVPADFSPEQIDAFRKAGVDVRVQAPEVASAPRFDISKTAPVRAYAERYVEDRAGDLDKAKLMAIFDDVVAEAG